MAINCYTGLMGSGKTYEVVSSVILPALAKGRRVVTNIAGVDDDTFRAYVHEYMGIELAKVGHLVTCANERILEPNFFPHSEMQVGDVKVVDDRETFCKGGDLICIDEAWRFWQSGNGAKLSQEHMIFFREHRHYADPETGFTCDLAFMVQDISDLMSKVKVVIEMTFRTTKLKKLGLHGHYRIEFWEGFSLTQGKKSGWRKCTYDSKIYALYSSYAGGSGSESVVDKRQNLLTSWFLWVYVIGLLITVPASIWGTWRFFHPNTEHAPVMAEKGQANTPITPITPTTAPHADGTAPAAVYSQQWRIVGLVKRGSIITVAIRGQGDMPLRYLPASKFVFEGGRPVAGDVDGQMVTDFSGASSTSTNTPSLLGRTGK